MPPFVLANMLSHGVSQAQTGSSAARIRRECHLALALDLSVFSKRQYWCQQQWLSARWDQLLARSTRQGSTPQVVHTSLICTSFFCKMLADEKNNSLPITGIKGILGLTNKNSRYGCSLQKKKVKIKLFGTLRQQNWVLIFFRKSDNHRVCGHFFSQKSRRIFSATNVNLLL